MIFGCEFNFLRAQQNQDSQTPSDKDATIATKIPLKSQRSVKEEVSQNKYGHTQD